MNIIVKSILSLCLAIALWGGAFSLRAKVIVPRCYQNPKNCGIETLWILDQFSVGRNIPYADDLSFITQDVLGVFALILPFSVFLYQKRTRFSLEVPLAASLHWAFLITYLYMLSTFYNGFTNEIVRLIVQRPRPFVFENPMEHGLNPAHYTSFYSGHTSFTAVAFYSVNQSSRWIRNYFMGRLIRVFAFLLFIFTGIFRILAGRHFFTDVLVGAFAGLLISYLIHRLIGSKILRK